MKIRLGVPYIVIKGGHDGSLQRGDRITFQKDHLLLHGTKDFPGGWLNKPEAMEALKGAMLKIDISWILQRKKALQEQIAGLDKMMVR